MSPTYEAVDLGLPSGLKWATMNVGATKPEEYGDYFAWGEVVPNKSDGYTWENYKFWTSGDIGEGNIKFSKYTTMDSFASSGVKDNKTTLDAEDDAASVNWGAGWRMPTIGECDELISYCTSEWTQLNGVNGRKFTGPNGNSIFLPAAGGWSDAGLFDGPFGYYWSSSLTTGSPYSALYLYLASDRGDISAYYRCGGFPVRPVTK